MMRGRCVIASDEELPVVAHVAAVVRARGHEVELLPISSWGEAALGVAREVAAGRAAFGIVCCHTGTGVSIAANKVRGVRAALCVDPETAEGARKWNDANVLALSLRLSSPAAAEAIVDAWLTTAYSGSEQASLEAIRGEEERR
jgi:ribose 5-phosphate isomerase B